MVRPPPWYRWPMGVLGFSVLLQIVLKYVEDIRSDNVHGVRDGIVVPLTHRLDDAYFWMLVAVLLAGSRVVSAWRRAGYPVPRLREMVRKRRVVIPALCCVWAAYLGSTCLEPGTFWIVPASIEQWIEGAWHLGSCAAGLLMALLGFELRKQLDDGKPGQLVARERLLSAASLPLWGFSVFFVAWQVITGDAVRVDEWMAVLGALAAYATPYLLLMLWCFVQWRRRDYDVRFGILDPFAVCIERGNGSRENGCTGSEVSPDPSRS